MCTSPACALPWQLRLRHHETTCLTGRSSFHWCVCVGTKHWIPLRGLHSPVPGNSVSRRLSNVWLWMSSSCIYNNIIAVEFTTSLTYSYGLSPSSIIFGYNNRITPMMHQYTTVTPWLYALCMLTAAIDVCKCWWFTITTLYYYRTKPQAIAILIIKPWAVLPEQCRWSTKVSFKKTILQTRVPKSIIMHSCVTSLH